MISVFKIKNNLRKMRKLIRTGWTQHSFHSVKVIDEEEVDCYCMLGAGRKASGYTDAQACGDSTTEQWTLYLDTIRYFQDKLGIYDVADWNDERSMTKDKVIASIDRAIAA